MGTLVAQVDSVSGLAGLAGTRAEHRHRRVVGVQGCAGAHVTADRLDQRRHQLGDPADPARQQRPGQRHPLAGVDLALAVQRQMVAVFRH